ncbi:hypothetical protein LshimejAT787_1802040 [Lyophyllum shimeji]|uniref:Uncharacterized protein n=1 Tax=Lyophyllum shimeji TaxID=47721 RepID=A0A9P3Q114_LYOSH|nr:hypothetical protein LshimejAT787_1802040 [Lyophyllum shimeji]
MAPHPHLRNNLASSSPCAPSSTFIKSATQDPIRRGPPPTDIEGNTGDVYGDVNPSRVMYIPTMEEWMAWNSRPTTEGKVKEVPLVAHPMLTDRYLWRSQQVRTWVRGYSVKLSSGNKIQPKTTLIDPTDMISDIFRHASRMSIGGIVATINLADSDDDTGEYLGRSGSGKNRSGFLSARASESRDALTEDRNTLSNRGRSENYCDGSQGPGY